MPLLTLLLSNLSASAIIVTMIVVGGAINRWGIQPSPLLGHDIVSAQSEAAKPQNFINLYPDNAEARDRAAELASILENSSHTPEQKLALALTDLANKDLRLEFEVIFRTIYGSQLEALRALRQEGPQPLAKFHQLFLGRVETSYPEPPPSHLTDFETWVGYLTRGAHPMISLDGGIAAITRTGSEFLAYVAIFAAPQLPPHGL